MKKLKTFGALLVTLVTIALLIQACSTTNTIACGTGSIDCNGTCTVLARDPENCGACGTKCTAGQSCVNGACAANACPNGTTKCGDACVATASDPANCGGCGTKCAASEVCSTGKCSSTCGANLTQCGMSCVDTKNDAMNCGMCGKACAMGESCTNGTCGFTCQAPLSLCYSNQMNPPPQPPPPDAGPDASSDASMEASVMDSGVMMDAGQGQPICVDLQNNDRHCGACGNFCYGNTKCNKGKCEVCTLCGGQCIDTRNSDTNCGGCGKTCMNSNDGGGASSCKNNYCCQQKIGSVYFQDDFSNGNAKAWTLDTNWEIGAAKASVGCAGAGQDPAQDHTQAGDNGIAGVVLGGCTGTTLHGYYYMTSATFDTSNANKVVFSFWRHLHSDYTPYMSDHVEVYDGMTWQVLYQNGACCSVVNDGSWTHVAYDVTQYKNNKMQVRIGFNIGQGGVYNAGGWNVDDVLVADDDCTP